MPKKIKIQIAPRLADGSSRVPFGHGLPEYIKEAIRVIAHDERKSMSWVIEEVIIDWFGFKRPEYKDDSRKNPNKRYKQHKSRKNPSRSETQAITNSNRFNTRGIKNVH